MVSSEPTTVHRFDGKSVAHLLPYYLPFPQTVVAKLDGDEEPYLAVLRKMLVGFEKSCSQLHVFNSQWKLVYHEVLELRSPAIAAVPSDRPGEQRLLVGGQGKVYQYKCGKTAHEAER
jgi:hypothetical protein